MTHDTTPTEQQWQAARQAAQPGQPGQLGQPDPGRVQPVGAHAKETLSGMPSGLVMAGAGTILAVLAFLGGTAVGHAWGSSGSTDPGQFGGPGRFQNGQAPQQGQVPQQGGTQQGQGFQPGQGTRSRRFPQNQNGQGTTPGGTGSGMQESSDPRVPGQQIPGQGQQVDGQTKVT
jgi:hypothetical protein